MAFLIGAGKLRLYCGVTTTMASEPRPATPTPWCAAWRSCRCAACPPRRRTAGTTGRAARPPTPRWRPARPPTGRPWARCGRDGCWRRRLRSCFTIQPTITSPGSFPDPSCSCCGRSHTARPPRLSPGGTRPDAVCTLERTGAHRIRPGVRRADPGPRCRRGSGRTSRGSGPGRARSRRGRPARRGRRHRRPGPAGRPPSPAPPGATP